MCWPVSRAESVCKGLLLWRAGRSCMCWLVSRDARELVSVGQYQGLRTYLHVFALVEVWS
jgi:hypothetical protein